MFTLTYDAKNKIAKAITTGKYDPTIAKEQMHQVISLPNIGDKLRVLRIFSDVDIAWNLKDINEHFAYVQDCLNKTEIKNCFLAIVTNEPVNTAMAVIYQSNHTSGNCFYIAKVFCTEDAATAWLMEN